MEMKKALLNEYEVRKNKLLELRTRIIPYANKFERTHTLIEATQLKDGDESAVCGRIIFKRSFGKFMFIKLWDLTGVFQISCSCNEIEDSIYNELKNSIDVGDFIGARGIVYRTKTGELTLKTLHYEILSKALRPLPEKFHGLSDPDTRYRHRYLDLICNQTTRDVFIKRSKTIQFIRNFLNENGFLEIETPILQTVASGAAAKPFMTKHNALDLDLFMRIAPELYLKQAIAGGFDRVFEIGKNFRNEGMDASHLQEFTMLEWYSAYWDFNDNIDFTRSLLLELLDTVYGSRVVEFDGHTIDFNAEWKKINYCSAVSDLIQSNILDYTELDDLKAVIKKYELLNKDELDKSSSIPALIDLLYKQKIRPYIIQPVILYNYPACLIPLARRNDQDSRIIDMFQLVVCGWEIVKAYSELIDPEIQRENFMEQAKNKYNGDDEAFEIDNDFLLAMEHGMPPMSGVGVGIDRLVAMLCNQPTLRDVVLFPTMKPID